MTNGSANAESIAFWNEVAGPKWVRLQAALDVQLEPLGNIVLQKAALARGESVLDVGCGCGGFTLQVAHAVGSNGRVCGVDVSQPMLEQARRLLEREGVTNVDLVCADAQTHTFSEQVYDAVLSRLGVMFFEDPVAAFSGLRRALRARGRLVFVCFQSVERNAWATLPMSVTERYVPVERPKPSAPGPFAFADAERTRGILEAAGFVDVRSDPVELDLRIGSGLGAHAAAAFLTELGPASGALRSAEPAVRDRVVAELAELLAPRQTPAGVLLPCSAWLASAH